MAILSVILWLGAPLRAESLQSAHTGQRRAAVRFCNPGARSNALWILAQCCAKDITSDPSCREFKSNEQYVVIKDNGPAKPDAYLIIPSKQVKGIEDSQIFALPVLNIWKYGWTVSRKYPGYPAPVTALAINSIYARDQNQLHIHISCVRHDVRRVLDSNDKRIGIFPARAVTLRLPPHNHIYEVVKVTSLAGLNSPFDVIRAMPGVKQDMADQSIAVIGSQKPGQYYVLDTHCDPSARNLGHAEELLDQTCKAATE